MSTLDRIRRDVEQMRGRQAELQRQVAITRAEQSKCETEAADAGEALVIVRAVALETQRQLEFHLSSLATLALSEIFGPSAYRLSVQFIERRGRTECDLYFQRGRRGEPVDPLSAAGGGAVDVAAFALRLSLWTMERSAPVMILDEPFRFLSAGLRPLAAELVKQLSERLHLQFIIVTHDETLAEAADRTFNTKMEGGTSHVEAITPEGVALPIVHPRMGPDKGERRATVVASPSQQRKRDRRLADGRRSLRRTT